MERRSHAAITEALANTWAADLVTQQATIDGRQTIRPPADTLDEQLLPPLRIGGKDAELELRERLGEGGMGVVERAWQRSIGRDVAIKLARDAKDSTRTTMVREARIAGSLEHPNIVPIHALGQDEHGQAVIVMKRVSGVSWRALLHSPEHALTGEGGRLLRSLEIMVQVCRALELAHSRGWLHRDLKTENVMVGEFGEVYVLDWGIAVPLDVARRGEATFAGTPAYMAPEMAAAGALTERTDVFLLGAILHEVLTGDALNEADTLAEMLTLACTSRVRRYPPAVPAELAAIAARATAYHPEDRYEDVGAFRKALAAFVVHRDALEIAERARAILDAVEAGATEDARGDLVEARSGLRQSLSLWPENETARDALRRCLTRLAELELEEDNPAAASAWAAQLDPSDAALEARIEERRHALEGEARELAALRGFAADRSLRSSAEERRRRAFVFGAVMAVVGFGAGAALRAGWFALDYRTLAIIYGIVAVGAALSAAIGRSRQNLVTRSLGATMVIATLMPVPTLITAWRLGLSAESALALDALVKGGGSIVLGVILSPAYRWVALSFVLVWTALLLFPGTFPLEIGTTGLVLALFFATRGRGLAEGDEEGA